MGIGWTLQALLSVLNLVSPLIVTGSVDSRLVSQTTVTGIRKGFSVLRNLGKHPNLLQILVTLIPLLWHFSRIEPKLELGGMKKILK